MFPFWFFLLFQWEDLNHSPDKVKQSRLSKRALIILRKKYFQGLKRPNFRSFSMHKSEIALLKITKD